MEEKISQQIREPEWVNLVLSYLEKELAKKRNI